MGDLVVGRWLNPRLRQQLVPALLALMGIGLLPLLALHPPVAVGAVCLIVTSIGSAYQLGQQSAFLAAAPIERQGLALGLANTGIQAGQGIGPLVAGALAELAGVGIAMSTLGVGILLATAVLAVAGPRRSGGS